MIEIERNSQSSTCGECDGCEYFGGRSTDDYDHAKGIEWRRWILGVHMSNLSSEWRPLGLFGRIWVPPSLLRFLEAEARFVAWRRRLPTLARARRVKTTTPAKPADPLDSTKISLVHTFLSLLAHLSVRLS